MFVNVKVKWVDTITCPENWSWESRKNGWKGYHIWYVTGGGATIEVEEKVYHLYQGDCFLFDLNKNHFCTHNPEHPLQVKAVYLQIYDSELMPVQNWVIRGSKAIGEWVCKCVENWRTNEEYAEIYLKAVLVEFCVDHEVKKENFSKITSIYELFDNNTEKLYSLDEMSKFSGYSKNQIIRLFRKHTGLTPIQFQMQQKMQYAIKMLMYSDKTITEIGAEIGLENANYFSKVFKKYIGKSPRHYRNDLQQK